ncbi:hypothetical protein P2318_06275 [Myxococcaceae bacterium GXIMD 01537]
MRPLAHIPRVAALAGAVLLAPACDKGPHLEGSAGELVDLGYEKAEARMSTEELSVRFLTQQGTGENTIFKVTARLKDTTFVSGTPLDLAEVLVDGAQRGSVGRSVLDEPVRAFPGLYRGTLTVIGNPAPGATVTGNFHVTFVNGTDVYSGRTLFGRFEATVP